MRILICAGGTGGHIYPALEVTRELINSGHEVVFVGSKYGIEGRIVPKTGIVFELISTEYLSRKSLIKKIYCSIKIIVGFFQSLILLFRYMPNVVVGFGGYVTVPLIVASIVIGKPTVICEQNVKPGCANILLSRFVNIVCISFEESKKYLKSKNVRITGNPVRKEIMNTSREDGAKNLNLVKNLFTTLVFGGTNGAHDINTVMIEVAKNLKNVQIIHITGKKDIEYVEEAYKKLGIPFVVKEYMDNIWNAYAVADLLVCRAGATTISEIISRGLPSILIPHPSAVDNHQYQNARLLSDNNAAILINSGNLSEEGLSTTITELIKDNDRRSIMAKNSKALGKTNAIENIINTIEELAREKNK